MTYNNSFKSKFLMRSLDFKFDSNVTKSLNKLKKKQWNSPAQLQKHQDKRIRALILHAYRNVPFYHRFWKRSNFDPLSIKGSNDMWNFIELERKYNLIYSLRQPLEAIRKADEIIQMPDVKDIWNTKRQALLDDKIDLSAFMVWFIEEWPESLNIINENDDYQLHFITKETTKESYQCP